MVEPLHRVRLPVSCQCATGRILSPAVGISYRLNGRVFRTVSVGWGITLPKNTPIVDSDRGCANQHGQPVDEQSACNFGETPRGELPRPLVLRRWVNNVRCESGGSQPTLTGTRSASANSRCLAGPDLVAFHSLRNASRSALSWSLCVS